MIEEDKINNLEDTKSSRMQNFNKLKMNLLKREYTDQKNKKSTKHLLRLREDQDSSDNKKYKLKREFLKKSKGKNLKLLLHQEEHNSTGKSKSNKKQTEKILMYFKSKKLNKNLKKN